MTPTAAIPVAIRHRPALHSRPITVLPDPPNASKWLQDCDALQSCDALQNVAAAACMPGSGADCIWHA